MVLNSYLEIVLSLVYTGEMIRLRLREIALARGLNINQTAIQSGVAISVVRRYWYSAADGKESGPPLLEVRLDFIEKLANLLGVEDVGELFEMTK